MTTQLDCSIGMKKETVYGTGVTPDQFLEFLSESFDRDAKFEQGKGLRPGYRVARGGRRVLVREGAKGSLTVEAPTKGLGALLEAALGTVTNTAVPAAAGVFQQVHSPAITDPLASYTIQKGIPPLGGGPTHALTFPGMMCASLEINAKESAIVEVTTDWTGREVLTATGYAPPAYPTPLDLFTFVHGAVYVGGSVTAPTATALALGGTSVANITELSVKWDNGLDAGGYTLGGAGKRVRKAVAGLASLGGKLGAEYDSVVLRDAFLAQTGLSLLLTFTHSSLIGTGTPVPPVLQLWVPQIKLDGELPKANGGDVITQSIDFTGLDPQVASQAPFYVVYRSTDAAP